ncbi:MAG TPA: rhomboid family intramembrane serine protease [Thermodesulfovibrionales bacterium]|nr:rhomboid family intramembrane serine protease [Thermodesulfovibrionales bacterium]
MIPYKDDNPTSIIPVVTVGIIILNIAVYLWEVFSPSGEQKMVFSYGAVPHNMLTLNKVQPVHPIATVFTSMFMHGGLFHLGGNMLYLWVFGNNIEDRLGHVRFLVYYLLAGAAAAYAHAFAEPDSLIPMIGASGAVSGVLGAYLIIFPQARVHSILFFGFFWQFVRVPALIVIGFWAIIQLVNGVVTKGLMGQSGVAWFAHVGGFLFGLLTIKLWLVGRRSKQWL